MTVQIFKRIETPFATALKQVCFEYNVKLVETRNYEGRLLSQNEFIRFLDNKYPGFKQEFDKVLKEIKEINK